MDTKRISTYLFLKNVSVSLTHSSKLFYFSDFLVLTTDAAKSLYQPGNRLQITGTVSGFQTPSSPGQFHEKAYYKEQNIFYKLTAKQITIKSRQISMIKQYPCKLREKILKVYQSCLSDREAGILAAMLLGEKSLLDADMKELYQVNGIGHILAISGLHVTLLCTLVYRFLFLFPLPKPFPFAFTTFFLFGYGIMTDFGISTSRAVLMMFLFLLARELGRSYDAPTALAFSAVIILLQKPYALFSCSFLLSYGAMAGVHIIYPSLRQIFPEKKKYHILSGSLPKCMRKALHSNNILAGVIHVLLQKLFSSLLLSISIWIATVPILLYFFYELPTYGIFLNLFVLPLVSAVVCLALSGGVVGLFYLPAAKPFLFLDEMLLQLYEWLCKLTLCLPAPVQVLGRPGLFPVFLYYVFLLLLCLYAHMEKSRKCIICPFYLCILFILLYRQPVTDLRVTMLDVGQGDGILLQTGTGRNILIDGGSTSIAEVGKYRILPYLKYYGIRKIDYLLMTHADEDHISGQRELLEDCRINGVAVKNYLLPELSIASQDSNYKDMIKAAQKAEIPISYINTGDIFSDERLQLVCLHPKKDFAGSSANACSVTLRLTYGNFSMLLTGDLEQEGEEAVRNILEQEMFYSKQQPFTARTEKGQTKTGYTVLKVAHHGSKNSTSEAFLKAVRPQISLISCGKRNRYGHPHAELLERLRQYHTLIYQTTECGVIWIDTDGSHVRTKTFLKYM